MNKRRKGGKPKLNTTRLDSVVRAEEGRRRSGRFWRGLGVALLVVTGLGAAGYYTWKYSADRYLYRNPHYTLRNIEVEVTGRITRDQVLSWTRVREGGNLYDVDVAAVQSMLREQPGIASAEVSREIPDTLRIKVSARTPVARLTQAGTPGVAFLVDADGYVMKPVFEDQAERLPEVTGLRPGELAAGRSVGRPEVLSAIRLLRLNDETGVRVDAVFQAVDVSRPGMLVVTTDTGVRLRFSTDSTRHAAQLKRYEQILDWCGRNQRKLGTVDLTVARNVPVTFVEEAPPAAPSEDPVRGAAPVVPKVERPPVNRNPGAQRG